MADLESDLQASAALESELLSDLQASAALESDLLGSEADGCVPVWHGGRAVGVLGQPIEGAECPYKDMQPTRKLQACSTIPSSSRAHSQLVVAPNCVANRGISSSHDNSTVIPAALEAHQFGAQVPHGMGTQWLMWH